MKLNCFYNWNRIFLCFNNFCITVSDWFSIKCFFFFTIIIIIIIIKCYMFELQDYFTLDDLRLPPIKSSYLAPVPVEVSNFLSGPRYENKPFALPKVDKGQQHVRQVPKTYTTRKGALLLYAEDLFLPGSPKPRKKRRKVKKPTALKLRTMNDLRNHILDYKNGVCYNNHNYKLWQPCAL